MLGGLVVPGNMRLGVEHHDTILNRIEQCTKKIPLTRQPLHDRLQALGIQLIHAPDNSVKKTGAFGSHYQSRHFASQKTLSECVSKWRIKIECSAENASLFGW
jgi:hypothetical protein